MMIQGGAVVSIAVAYNCMSPHIPGNAKSHGIAGVQIGIHHMVSLGLLQITAGIKPFYCIAVAKSVHNRIGNLERIRTGTGGLVAHVNRDPGILRQTTDGGTMGRQIDKRTKIHQRPFIGSTGPVTALQAATLADPINSYSKGGCACRRSWKLKKTHDLGKGGGNATTGIIIWRIQVIALISTRLALLAPPGLQ